MFGTLLDKGRSRRACQDVNSANNWFVVSVTAIVIALSVGCDNPVGPSEDAVTTEITTCSGVMDFTRVNVTIGGTVRANRSVRFVTVTGYANDQRLFPTDSLGFMDRGDVETFTITGDITATTQTTVECRVEVSFQVD